MEKCHFAINATLLELMLVLAFGNGYSTRFSLENITQSHYARTQCETLETVSRNYEQLIDAVSRLESKDAVKKLMHVYSKVDLQSKVNIIKAMGTVKSEYTADQLKEIVAVETDRLLIFQILEALSDLDYSSSLSVFENKLSDHDFQIQKVAIISLGKMKDSSVSSVILRNFHLFVNVECKYMAISVLGHRKDPTALPVLHSILISEKLSSLRAAAAFAVGEIGSKKSTQYLVKALNDENNNVRCNAADALMILGDDSAYDALINGLQDIPRVRWACASGISHLNISGKDKYVNAAIDEMINAIKTNPGMARVILYYLKYIGNFYTIQQLIKNTTDSDELFSQRILAILQQITGERYTETNDWEKWLLQNTQRIKN